MRAGLDLSLMGEDVVRWDRSCRVTGCKGEYRHGKGGTGQGYCAKHYRAVLRFGHPGGHFQKSREALREAAFSFADALNWGNDTGHAKAVLAAAAWNLLAARGGGCSQGPATGASADLLATLCDTANLYAWWDDTDDEGFEQVSKKLDADALAYAKSVARWVPRGHVASVEAL